MKDMYTMQSRCSSRATALVQSHPPHLLNHHDPGYPCSLLPPSNPLSRRPLFLPHLQHAQSQERHRRNSQHRRRHPEPSPKALRRRTLLVRSPVACPVPAARVLASRQALVAKGDVLRDGGIEAVAVDDVEVFEIVLVEVSVRYGMADK